MGGIGPHLGEILGFENVNFGPLYILTSLGGPTPDLTREHYFKVQKLALSARFCLTMGPFMTEVPVFCRSRPAALLRRRRASLARL